MDNSGCAGLVLIRARACRNAAPVLRGNVSYLGLNWGPRLALMQPDFLGEGALAGFSSGLPLLGLLQPKFSGEGALSGS